MSFHYPLVPRCRKAVVVVFEQIVIVAIEYNHRVPALLLPYIGILQNLIN